LRKLKANHVNEPIPNWQQQRWLFGTCSKDNINLDIQKARAKAGVDYYPTHARGRHKAARNFLRAGGSIKAPMKAFRWKSRRMPLMHYGHEEQSEITERVHAIGREWLANLKLQSDKQGTIGDGKPTGANLGQIEEAESGAGKAKSKKSGKSAG
jgi:hypothetical protein